MRFLVLTTSYPRFVGDDSSVFVERLVQAIAERGNKLRVIVPYDANELMTEQREQVSIERFRYGLFFAGQLAFGAGILPNLRANPLRVLQAPGLIFGFVLKAIVHRRNTDVVQANWLLCGFAAWISYLLTRTPYIITVRGEDQRLIRSAYFRWVFLPALRQARAVISVSSEYTGELIDKCGLFPQRCQWIANGVQYISPTEHELQELREYYGLKPEGKYLIFVGRLIEIKRPEVLIEMLSHPTLSDYELLLCGRAQSDEYLLRVKQSISNAQLEPRVHVLGAVAPAKIAGLLTLSRYYLSASEYEGRPNSMLEAMAAGLPCVVSEIAAHKKIVNDSVSGFTFDPKKLELAVQYIRDLDQNSDEYKRVSVMAKNYAGQFSWLKSAQQYEAVASTR